MHLLSISSLAIYLMGFPLFYPNIMFAFVECVPLFSTLGALNIISPSPLGSVSYGSQLIDSLRG